VVQEVHDFVVVVVREDLQGIAEFVGKHRASRGDFDDAEVPAVVFVAHECVANDGDRDSFDVFGLKELVEGVHFIFLENECIFGERGIDGYYVGHFSGWRYLKGRPDLVQPIVQALFHSIVGGVVSHAHGYELFGPQFQHFGLTSLAALQSK